jgi:hypothetical protein
MNSVSPEVPLGGRSLKRELSLEIVKASSAGLVDKPLMRSSSRRAETLETHSMQRSYSGHKLPNTIIPNVGLDPRTGGAI